jgi:hypothetical protein
LGLHASDEGGLRGRVGLAVVGHAPGEVALERRVLRREIPVRAQGIAKAQMTRQLPLIGDEMKVVGALRSRRTTEPAPAGERGVVAVQCWVIVLSS